MANSQRTCSIEGCNGAHFARGFCSRHYQQYRLHGAPDSKLDRHSVIAWLTSHASYAGDDCLKWPFFTAPNGRGQLRFNGQTTTAPNCMCQIAHGPAPSPLHEAAHSCGNGRYGCVNPNHLRWKTRVDNAAESVSQGLTTQGRKSASVVLTEDEVRQMRALEGAVTYVEMGRMFGVHTATATSVCKRRTWKWLT